MFGSDWFMTGTKIYLDHDTQTRQRYTDKQHTASMRGTIDEQIGGLARHCSRHARTRRPTVVWTFGKQLVASTGSTCISLLYNYVTDIRILFECETGESNPN